jgi:hypothetical protein
MQRLGADIDWTSTTWTGTAPTMSAASSTVSDFFGSLTLVTGMTQTSVSGGSFRAMGRSSHDLTANGVSFPSPFSVASVGGTYSLQSSWNSPTNSLTITLGTFTSNDYTISQGSSGTGSSFTITSAAGVTVNLGTSIVNLSSTNGGTIFSAGALATVNASSATFNVLLTTANKRDFIGGGKTYGTLNYTVAGSTGTLQINDSNTFDKIEFSDITNARTLMFVAGTTTTFTGDGIVGNGAAGRVLVLASTTTSIFTLTKASGTVSIDYWSISYSTATGGASWYAGANSTNGGNNSGWTFTAPPATSTGNFFALF